MNISMEMRRREGREIHKDLDWRRGGGEGGGGGKDLYHTICSAL